MKKSPFSTPRGNGARRGFGRNSAGTPRQGYGHPRIYDFSSPYSRPPQQSPTGSEDFIPFNSSPQSTNFRKSNDQWQTPQRQWKNPRGQWSTPRHAPEAVGPAGNIPRRHSSSPIYANSRNNYNHQHTPYNKDSRRKSFNGARKMFPHRNEKANVNDYVDMKSFLEDPWEELEDSDEDTSNPAEEARPSSSSSSISDNTAPMDSSVSHSEAANGSLAPSESSVIEANSGCADLSACSKDEMSND